MKAKQYAQMFFDAPLEEKNKVLGEICLKFLNEFKELADKRNIKTEVGLLKLLEEFYIKYRKFAQIVNKKYYPLSQKKLIKSEGFIDLIRSVSPGLYGVWKNRLN